MGALRTFLFNINGRWHKIALAIFMAGVVGHMAEHLVQAVQIYAFDQPISESRGIAGQWMPWLATSESMHYFYAIYTLAGLVLLLPAIEGQARFWWSASLLFQLWHHFEHATLLVQSVSGQYYFGESMPVSIVQTLIPRVELHLMYNTLVFVPMVIAIIIHFYPSAAEQQELICGCSARARQGLVVSKGAI